MVSESQLSYTNRQLIVLIRFAKLQVDDFWGQLTFQNHFINTLWKISVGAVPGSGSKARTNNIPPHASANKETPSKTTPSVNHEHFADVQSTAFRAWMSGD